MTIKSPEVELPRHPLHGEVANTFTHGAGLVMSLAGTAAVVFRYGFHDRTAALAFGTYAATLVAVYAVSALSHGVPQPKTKYRLRVWDQGLIYLLIAGTYTPLICAYLAWRAQLLLLATVWSLAMFGFLSKIWMQHRINRFAAVSYVLLGWIPAMALVTIVDTGCLAWIVAGGVSYTLGTYFLKLDRAHAHDHAVWHILVLIGSACHFWAIVQFAVVRAGV